MIFLVLSKDLFSFVSLYNIFPDDDLKETDCIIESTFGRIDASVDSQLHELKLKLLQILEGEMEDEKC